ncbi:peptidoglycan amidohydrolase family protein [Limosilactobacillus vaginalis]|uniref:peptidoglycan amidohydrolase family protein n=1 Tax=Limosilactobacillus vaginalis TaxID=1633 RepID=UPI001F08C78A|nr:peptidoglycan amidohydrolase family protein [Limosilactobacillus vaginalis]
MYSYYNAVSYNGGYFLSSSAQADTNDQPQANSTVVATSALTSSTTNEAPSAEAQSAIVEAAENTSGNKQGAEVKTDTTTASATAKQAATTSTITGTITPENSWNSDHTAFYQNGKLANGYVQADDGNYYMFNNGTRQKGVQKWMGTYYYFDPTTYLRVDNDYREQVWQDGTHDWYMFGKNGQIVTGKYDWQGNVYYFDPSSYLKVVNDYRATESDGRGVLLGNDGRIVQGFYNWKGSLYYFDNYTFLKVTNDWRDGVYFGSDGRVINPGDTFSGRVINWFRNHEGKLTYSMYGSRNGEDGTADCSGAMTEALYEAGATKPNEIYDTGSISPYLLLNGYSLVYEGQEYYNPRFGDIVIWGPKNHTTGGNGHMVIVSNMSSNPNCISVNWLSRGKKGAAVSENNYYWYWNTHGKQYQQVFRPNNIEKS